jgi:hypothetical protein
MMMPIGRRGLAQRRQWRIEVRPQNNVAIQIQPDIACNTPTTMRTAHRQQPEIIRRVP